MNDNESLNTPCLAPIVLFVYNRLWHTRQTIEALLQNELAAESELFIYADGPKKLDDYYAVNEVQKYIRNIGGFRSVTISERGTNFGLANSIISGVSDIVNRYGKIIVLEDDMVTSPFFLRFMNEALEIYEREERVISIHGYVYPNVKVNSEFFFIKGADCWAWATWSRGWNLFDPDGSNLLRKLREHELEHRFNLEGAYSFTGMLKKQITGKVDSWAIRWYASALVHEKLTLYPCRSLAQNIGNDESGTNCGTTSAYNIDLSSEPIRIKYRLPVEDPVALRQFREFHKSLNISLFKRIIMYVNIFWRWYRKA